MRPRGIIELIHFATFLLLNRKDISYCLGQFLVDQYPTLSLALVLGVLQLYTYSKKGAGVDNFGLGLALFRGFIGT